MMCSYVPCHGPLKYNLRAFACKSEYSSYFSLHPRKNIVKGVQYSSAPTLLLEAPLTATCIMCADQKPPRDCYIESSLVCICDAGFVGENCEVSNSPVLRNAAFLLTAFLSAFLKTAK
eukprot:5707838-Pyramimonas_sp.AAC.1